MKLKKLNYFNIIKISIVSFLIYFIPSLIFCWLHNINFEDSLIIITTLYLLILMYNIYIINRGISKIEGSKRNELEKQYKEVKKELKLIFTSIVLAYILAFGYKYYNHKDSLIFQVDKESQLMWLDSKHEKFDLYDAKGARDICKAYAKYNLGGYNNWRLPTIDEMKDLGNKIKKYNIDEEFIYLERDYYWTSTKLIDEKDGCGKTVNFSYNFDTLAQGFPKHNSNMYYALCIRNLNQDENFSDKSYINILKIKIK